MLRKFNNYTIDVATASSDVAQLIECQLEEMPQKLKTNKENCFQKEAAAAQRNPLHFIIYLLNWLGLQ